jgi:hypothetical protein
MKSFSTVDLHKIRLHIGGLLAMSLLFSGASFAQETAIKSAAIKGAEEEVTFDMVRSPGLAAFPRVAPHAHGSVKIESLGPVEVMKVKVWGLPPNTDFDLFVIQVPNKPFGLAWYQGDIETDTNGVGYGEFIGRFSIETFIVAQGMAPAPPDPFHDLHRIPDASFNPVTNPVQTYHLGLWFNNPSDVVKAGGPNTVTPFNGEHHAGVQVLNTSDAPANAGPLKRVH